MSTERPLHHEEEADREIPVYRLKDYLSSLEKRFNLLPEETENQEDTENKEATVIGNFIESLGTKQALTAETASVEVAPGVYWEYPPPELVKLAGTSLPKSSKKREEYLSKLPDKELKDGYFSVVEVIEKGGKTYRHGRYFANCDEFLDTLTRPDEAGDIQKNTPGELEARENFFKTLRKESRNWYEKSSLLAAMSANTWKRAAEVSGKYRDGDGSLELYDQQPLLRRRRLSEVLNGSEGMMKEAIQEIITTFNYYVQEEKDSRAAKQQGSPGGFKDKVKKFLAATKEPKKTFEKNKLRLTDLTLRTGIPEKAIQGIQRMSRVLGGYLPEAFWTKRNLKQKFRDWYFVGKIEEKACASDVAHVGTAVVEGIVSDLVMRQFKFIEATEELREKDMIGDFPMRERTRHDNLGDYMKIMRMAQANADPTLVHQLDPKGRKEVIDLAEIEYEDKLNGLSSYGSDMVRFFYVSKGDSKPRFIDIPVFELQIDGGESEDVGAVIKNYFSPGFTEEYKRGIHGLLEKILQGEEAEFTLPGSNKILQSHEFEDRNLAGMKTVLGSFVFHQHPFNLVENYSDILHSQGQAFVVTMEHSRESSDGKVRLKNVIPRLPHIIWEGKPASELLVDIGERIFANAEEKYEDLDFSLGEKRKQKTVSFNGDVSVDFGSDDRPYSITYFEELRPMSSGDDADDITLDPREISKQFKRDTRVWWLGLMKETGIEMGDGAEAAALNKVLEKYNKELRGEAVTFQDSDFEFLPKLMDEVIARYVEKVAGADERINASAILENEADRESLRKAFEYAMFPPFFPTLVESFVASVLYESSVAVCVAPNAREHRLALAINKSPFLPSSRWEFSQAEAEGATQLINAQAAISDVLVLAGMFGEQEDLITKLNALAMPEIVKWMSDPFLQHSSLGAAFAGASKPVRAWLEQVFGFTTSSSEMGMNAPVMGELYLPTEGKNRRGQTVHFQDKLSREISERSRELTNGMFALAGDLYERFIEYQSKNNISDDGFLELDISDVLDEDDIDKLEEEINLLKDVGLGRAVVAVAGMIEDPTGDYGQYVRKYLQNHYVSRESGEWLKNNTSNTLKKAREKYLWSLSKIYQKSIIT